ncbi:MAG: hypothetical protein ABI905_10790 [Betaproteobacteria bacterium]
MIFSKLVDFFRNRNRGYASPWLQLTVLCAIARDGIEPTQSFALRGKVLAATPIQFEFKDSNTYLVFFRGSEEGMQNANGLAESLRAYAQENAIPAFGVGVVQGECLAQMGPAGRLAGKPAGKVIADAMRLATDDANANAARQTHAAAQPHANA